MRKNTSPWSGPAHAPRILLLALLPIGDTLFVTPTLRAVRARYPDARLVALAYAATAPLLRTLPELDAVLIWPAWRRGMGLLALARLVARLRRARFDVCVDFTSPFFKWIPLLAGIRRRTYMKFDRLWWLIPGAHRRWRATHAVRHYYDCARELDLAPWDAVDHTPVLPLPAEACQEADAYLRAHDLSPASPASLGVTRSATGRSRFALDERRGPLVALHPGGAGMAGHKRWPAERFAALGDALAERWGARVLVLGGADELNLAHAVVQAMRAPAVVANGELSLLASFALIARCDLFVGNDSSPLHAAAALGTPYVGIFGPTCLANFQPLPCSPRQGRLVAAWPPSATLTYFVGGRPIWELVGATGATTGLGSIMGVEVLAQAEGALGNGQRGARSPSNEERLSTV